MTSEYRCLWALSNPVEGTAAGGIYKTYGKDTSFLILTGKDNRAMWFIFDKMDKVHRVPNIPKFTQQDAHALVEKHLRTKLTDQVSVADLWAQRISFSLLPLEEALYDKWTWGRFACIGDSAHKMTPNIGQGGNNAIESAAAIANTLHDLLSRKGSTRPSSQEIEEALQSFQDHREARTKKILTLANKITRLEALKGPVEAFASLHILPHLGGVLQDRQSAYLVASERLNFLPEPERALKATMPFNQDYGKEQRDTVVSRSLRALPLLVFAIFATQTSILGTSTPFAFTNLLPLGLLWMFERHRRANLTSLTSYPLLFALALLRYNTTAIIAIYAFLHYVESPLHKYAATDQRTVDISHMRAALTSIAIGIALWQFNFIRQLPLTWIVILRVGIQIILPYFRRGTRGPHLFLRPEADLPILRYTMKTAAAIVTVVRNWNRDTQGQCMAFELIQAIVLLGWMWLLFEDLRAAKLIETSRLRLFVGMVLGTVAAGPGAVLCGLWLWREEVLASRPQETRL